MRLDKYLADMGAGTRSEIRKSIRKNGAMVGEQLIFDPGVLLDGFPEVIYQGETWQYEPVVWYMMNKPSGVLSASEDRKQRTVLDLIAERKRTDLFPVGRLDKDTEGLLLITNDGETAHRLLAPKFHVDTTYLVRTGVNAFTEENAASFAEGIRYDKTLTALPAKMRIAPFGDPREALVTIREGKFHQIKKMVAALGGGREVSYLRRVSFGPLSLDSTLAPGEYRRLTGKEIEALLACVQGGAKDTREDLNGRRN